MATAVTRWEASPVPVSQDTMEMDLTVQVSQHMNRCLLLICLLRRCIVIITSVFKQWTRPRGTQPRAGE